MLIKDFKIPGKDLLAWIKSRKCTRHLVFIFHTLSVKPLVGVRSHSWIAAGVSLKPIGLCHYLLIKGDEWK
jgi:hypothetical protein